MRYAIISDVHSNLEALQAFFKGIDTLDVDDIVCLGDIVGYNANPNECVQLLREKSARCVMGNHDSRAAGLQEPEDFNLQAAEAILWTREALTDDNKKFLASLPRALYVDESFYAVHGWVNDTDLYIMGASDAKKNFELLKEQKEGALCFFGHTHISTAYIETNGAVEITPETALQIQKGGKYLINPGGLGQPRDRDPRAPFLVYDSKKSEITFHRVEYDILKTAEKIISAGLPLRLAERLKLGW